MAYQNVGTPRFYINIPEWLSVTGAVQLPENDTDNKLLTLPVEMSNAYDIDLDFLGMADNGFLAVLGHDISPPGSNSYSIEDYTSAKVQMTNVINGDPNQDGWCYPQYSGFSITTFTGSNDIEELKVSEYINQIGSVVIGTYYDMPHSPELDLTMTREMGNSVKRIRTKGGSDLVDYRHIKSPTWGSLAAWELSYPTGSTINQALSRSGRRIWDLSFNYMQGSDMFGLNQSLSSGLSGTDFNGNLFLGSDYDAGDINMHSDVDDTGTDTHGNFNYNLLTDDNFFSQVIHKTNGGQLPFIFQPDGDGDTPGSGNNNPDQFAICKFDMKSFKFDQVANGVYNMKLKIREVW